MSAIRNMVLGPGGRLMNPGFHDGWLTSITMSDDGQSVSIGLRRFSGERFLLCLSGVESLLATEFRQGNIVLDVVLASGIEPRDMEAFRRLVGAPEADATASIQERFDAKTRQKLSDVSEGRAVFVQIEASYGCDLACLCRSAEVVVVGE